MAKTRGAPRNGKREVRTRSTPARGRHTVSPECSSPASSALPPSEYEFLHRVPVGFIVVSEDGSVKFANREASRIFARELRGPSKIADWLDIVFADREQAVLALQFWKADIRSKAAPLRLLQIVRPDGVIRWCQFQTCPLADRDFLTSVQDVTEARQVEVALAESEKIFRDLAEESPNMIFINCRGRVVYASRRCVEVMGYSREEFYAEDFDFLCLIAPEYRERVKKAAARHTGNEEVYSYDYVILTKTGGPIEVVITSKGIWYRNQPAILGIVTDVSELTRAQRELREAAVELRQQRDALQEKNIALKELLAQIETEKAQIRRQVVANVERLIAPTVAHLKLKAAPSETALIQLLEDNLAHLTSEFGVTIGSSHTSLSPREIEISNMTRSGMTSKEIARILGISPRTIDTFRNRIRKKLGLAHRDVNLVTHLRSLSDSASPLSSV